MDRTHSLEIARFARDVLDKEPVFLDTETSGIDTNAEIVEIAVLDHHGNALLDTLVKPTRDIPYDVTEIHGITNGMVADAPSFGAVWPHLNTLLQSHPVVIYNSAFDLRLLSQSAIRAGIQADHPQEIYCAMLMFAEFYGDWDEDRDAWRWWRLGEAVKLCGIELGEDVYLHRAAADCEATRQVMDFMAARAEDES